MNNILTLDSEFTGLHQGTTLISIAFYSDNCEFYAEFTDYDRKQVDQWLQENIIANLLYESKNLKLKREEQSGYTSIRMVGSSPQIAIGLKEWLAQFEGKSIIVSDCLAYDWVLFSELFGGGLDLDKRVNVEYIPMDICTLFWDKGIDPDINREEYSGMTEGQVKHNSLWDAKVIMACLRKLKFLKLTKV